MDNLKGSRILVTGGAGFIGSHVVDKLLEKDIKQIIIYDNLSSGQSVNLNKALSDSRVVFVKRDMADNLTLDYAIFDSDYIFHLASIDSDSCAVSPEAGLISNVIGTFNLLRSAQKYKIKKIIYTSDSYSLGRNNFYDATKMSAEKMIRSFFVDYGIPSILLKLPTVYGERDRSNNDINNAIESILNKESINVEFNEEQVFDLVHIDDIVDFIMDIVDSEIIHVGYKIRGLQYKIQDIINNLISISGENLTATYNRDSIQDYSYESNEDFWIKNSLTLLDGLKKQFFYKKSLKT